MQGVIRISKEFHFDMAHSLDDHLGKCRNIHGHSYVLTVTLSGVPINKPGNSDNGMLIDFGDLKQIVNSNVVNGLDHYLVLWEGSPFLNKDNDVIGQSNLRIVDFQPTCENLVLYIANILKSKFPDNVRLHSLFLRETASSYAEWYASDN